MYINATGYYIPQKRIPNEYFTQLNGLTDEWIEQRTGIKSRSRASDKESLDYMSNMAVKNAIDKLPYNISEVDLVVFASYTISDTIATTGHYIQREYNICNARVFHVSSACSSAINAMEIIQTFFHSQVASKALMICADRNSTYSDDSDCISGHLWGDGATAFFFSDHPYTRKDHQVLDIMTQGLGHISKGPEGVHLNPKNGGLQMPFGKDVFVQACTYIAQNTRDIMEWNGRSPQDLSYFIGHQANMRILKNVARQLEMPEDKILTNIEDLGNTGSASSMLVFAQNEERFKAEDLICISVFGGGYSAGACLIKAS